MATRERKARLSRLTRSSRLLSLECWTTWRIIVTRGLVHLSGLQDHSGVLISTRWNHPRGLLMFTILISWLPISLAVLVRVARQLPLLRDLHLRKLRRQAPPVLPLPQGLLLLRRRLIGHSVVVLAERGRQNVPVDIPTRCRTLTIPSVCKPGC